MPRRTRLTAEHAAVASALATAWTECTIIDRRYPTVFATAMAEALGIPTAQRALFVNAMNDQYRGQENDRAENQLGTVRPARGD